jgi:hypothetical protein
MEAPSASTPNVPFAFDLALRAAADLYGLSDRIDTKQEAWTGEADVALRDWLGPHADHFRSNKSANGTDAATIVDALRTTADLFALKWAEARGNQDRINWARWVEAQIQAHEEDSWWGESAWDSVHDFFYRENPGGGVVPGNPPVPTADDGYAPTREPMYPEYGP